MSLAVPRRTCARLAAPLVLAVALLLPATADAALYWGTSKADSWQPGGGMDLAWGNGGNDVIVDHGGPDELNGNGGDDQITGDEFDRITGGSGNDRITVRSAGELAFRVECGSGKDTVTVLDAGRWSDAEIRSRISSCETVVVQRNVAPAPEPAPAPAPAPAPEPEPAPAPAPAPEPAPAPAPAPTPEPTPDTPPAPTFPVKDNVRDTFDRTSLGTTWASPVYPGAPGTPAIASGRLQLPTDTWGSAYLATTRYAGDQEISVTKAGAGSIGIGACLRNPGAGHSGYSLELDGSGALWLWRHDSGAETELFRAYSDAGTVGVGDGLGLRVADGRVEAWIRPAGGAWKLARTVTDTKASACSGFLGVSGYEGSLDNLRGGGASPQTVAPPPAPAPEPQPMPTPAPAFALGVHTGDRDIDYRATDVLRPGLVRVGGMHAGMTRTQVQAIADRYAAKGTRIIALVDFNDAAPSEAESRNLGTWATVTGLEAIEFGNEPWLNPGWDYGQYARSFKAAQDAVLAANPTMTLIAVGDSANRSHRPGLEVMKAMKAIGVRPRAVQFHPYGPGYLNRLSDVRRDLAEVGWSDTEIWASEVGVSTDDGRTVYQGGVPNNYGWSASMTYAQAATTIEQIVTDLKNAGVLRVVLYMGTDYRAPGTSNEREYYFGLTTSTNGEKGALTAKARELLARHRG